MHNIDRRRCLRAGALGRGAGLLEPGAAAAQGGPRVTGVTAEPTSTRIRMTGDGLGLTAGDQARLLTRLADDGQIDRDSYSNGGTVEELEHRIEALEAQQCAAR